MVDYSAAQSPFSLMPFEQGRLLKADSFRMISYIRLFYTETIFHTVYNTASVGQLQVWICICAVYVCVCISSKILPQGFSINNSAFSICQVEYGLKTIKTTPAISRLAAVVVNSWSVTVMNKELYVVVDLLSYQSDSLYSLYTKHEDMSCRHQSMQDSIHSAMQDTVYSKRGNLNAPIGENGSLQRKAYRLEQHKYSEDNTQLYEQKTLIML